MNSSLVWILFPGLVAIFLFFIRRWAVLTTIIGISTVMALALLAWRLPISEAVALIPIRSIPPIEIADTLIVFGRQFILNNGSRPVLVIIYLAAALWFVGSVAARATSLFIPIGLAITALLTAALAVNPFLYAAIFIFLAVLLSIPLLAPPGQPTSPGILRFLAFQTLGMIFILIAGWLAARIELQLNNSELIFRTSLLLGFGFAMIMGAFPFHTWIPIIAEQTQPYMAAFIFFTLPEVVALIGYSFILRFPWLEASPILITVLQVMGAIMIALGGIWASFKDNLGRIFGYAVIIEIGLSFISISFLLEVTSSGLPALTALPTSTLALNFFFVQIIPRGLNLAVGALALVILSKEFSGLDHPSVIGAFATAPVASIAFVVSIFSFAGFPLLAGFPIRFLLSSYLGQSSLLIAGMTILGYAGLMFGGLRSLWWMVGEERVKISKISENRFQLVLLILGCFVLVLIGFLPSVLLSSINTLGFPITP
jgi:NADH-quinone oxidoreductase subunit N